MQAPECRTYTSKGRLTPSTVSLTDPIFVGEAFNVGDVSVLLDISHRRIGALQVITSYPGE